MGGGGLGALAWFGGWERIFHRCADHYWLGHYAISHWAFGPSAVLERVSPQARETMLAGMMAGSHSMCFGMSEPDAGSDAMMMKTRAVRDGDGWRISGSKIFISGGDHDLTQNIIHMVIAKIPDEYGKVADDLSTVNFFMVPKVVE